MADVKWIKIVTDIFDDEKMLLIESLPSADSLIVIWFKLLCLAKKRNINGFLALNDHIFLDEDMLSVLVRKPKDELTDALETLEKYGLVRREHTHVSVINIDHRPCRDRMSPEYKRWRNAVFERDSYTCQSCGESGVHLNAHHKKSWKSYPAYRFDVSNGVTLCERCHKEYHKKYGR